MARRRRVRFAYRFRKSRLFRTIYATTLGTPDWSSTDWASFAREGYQMNPFVYAAIREKQTTIGGVRPVLYHVTKKSSSRAAVGRGYEGKSQPRAVHQNALSRLARAEAAKLQKRLGLHASICKVLAFKHLVEREDLELLSSHPALDLLERPNPWWQTSYADFIDAYMGALELGGMAFIEPIVSSKNPEELEGEPTHLYVHNRQGWKGNIASARESFSDRKSVV